MISENKKNFNPHRLLPNLLDKINLKINDKYVAFQTLTYNIQRKIFKKQTRIINLKYQLRQKMKG